MLTATASLTVKSTRPVAPSEDPVCVLLHQKPNPSSNDSHKWTIKAPAAMRNKPPGPIGAPYQDAPQIRQHHQHLQG
ncbi:hypothetical protein O988_07075 [Pseudogymnoascus sp. VKM F-3808]|nr:hypothetical protein O988_07075 [Pseudogymnoascus sp. VKM F-3808]